MLKIQTPLMNLKVKVVFFFSTFLLGIVTVYRISVWFDHPAINKIRPNFIESVYNKAWKVLARPTSQGGDIFIYSVFRRDNTITAVALVLNNFNHINIYCHYDNSDKQEIVATMRYVHYPNGREYRAAFIICKDSPNASEVHFSHAYWDGISRMNSVSPNIHITNSDTHLTENAEAPPSFVVCVKPFFNIVDINLVAQFLAYYKAHGADKFVIYMLSATKDVLNFFENHKSLVELLPWPSPKDDFLDISDIHKTIEANGQFASSQDCLFRYQRSLIALVDFDEYLVPKKSTTLKQMAEKERIKSPTSAAFVFPNAFFCDQLNNDTSSFPYIFNRFVRQNHEWPRGAYSKPLVIQPRYVDEMSVHFPHRLKKGFTTNYIEGDMGESYHYRFCDDERKQPTNDTRIDRTIVRYQHSVQRYLNDILPHHPPSFNS